MSSMMLLMLQSHSHEKNAPLKTLYNLLQASYTTFIKKENNLSHQIKYLRQVCGDVFSQLVSFPCLKEESYLKAN